MKVPLTSLNATEKLEVPTGQPDGEMPKNLKIFRTAKRKPNSI